MREDVETSLTNHYKMCTECTALLAVKRSAGIAPEVNLGIRCMQTMKHASGESIFLFETQARHQVQNSGITYEHDNE